MEHDNWTLPVDGQEQGINFTQLPEGVRLFDVRGRWSDGFGPGATEKVGYAVHHAGPPDARGDGSLASELEVINGIHRFHTSPEPGGRGWPGIGYHRLIGSNRRVYLVAGSATQRAHVRMLNHLYIGWCFLGDWSNETPDLDRRAALRVGTQWETDRRGVPMLIAPHKRLNTGETECPGAWAAVDAWQTITIQPGGSPPWTPPPAPLDLEAVRRAEALDALRDAEAALRRARDVLEA